MSSAMVILLFVVLLCVCFKAESTDIAAVYKHGIIILRNVESENSIRSAEDLYVELPQKFIFPVAVTQEPLRGTLFVADLNNEETDIFAINLRDKSPSVSSLVSKLGLSAIESMIYDPIEHKILWTDSSKNGIYSAQVPVETDKDSPRDVIFNESVDKPRGITLDYCKRDVYWTERYGARTIKRFNMRSKAVEIVARAERNTYYQAIDFNRLTNELIWAETDGDDESNSSCTIMSVPSATGTPIALASFAGCYPFSLTSDKDYIYWSDWSRSGIMRLSRKDPTDLQKLIDAPKVKTEFGIHDGVFGIVNLREPSEEVLCPKPLDTDKKEVPSWKKPKPLLPFRMRNIDAINAGTEASSLQQEDATMLSSGIDGVSSSASTFHDFSLRRLRLIIIILSIVVVFFMTTTIILLTRNFCASQFSQNVFKGIFFSISTTTSSESSCPTDKKKRPYKRFGIPKSKAMEGALCPREADDGIKIEIEDCCQMTLCDTPCYTSLKKEGKTYRSSSVKESKTEDKKCLLEDEIA